MTFHELLERAFSQARPQFRVNEICTEITRRKHSVAVAEHWQAVQHKIVTTIRLDRGTGIAEVAGISAHRDEGSGRRMPALH